MAKNLTYVQDLETFLKYYLRMTQVLSLKFWCYMMHLCYLKTKFYLRLKKTVITFHF